MLSGKGRVGCEVKEASICRRSEIVLNFTGRAKLAGRPGTLQGRLVFRPGGLSPEETDSLGSFIAHRLLECRGPMEVTVGGPRSSGGAGHSKKAPSPA